MRKSAFTIIELLVVIVILTIVTLIAIPSFTAMIYNQEQQLAEGLLRVGMKTGRDAALRSQGDDDAALVFFYGPSLHVSMVPCVRVGVLNETINGEPVEREVFVPASDLEPLQLPRGWFIRGYASPGSVGSSTGWYETGNGQANRYDAAVGNWVFPETDFYDATRHDSGVDRQTFMVRFRARTGEIVTSPSAPVLVVSPRQTYLDRNGLPAGGCNANRLDLTPDLVASVRCILTSEAFTNAQRAELIGDQSSDVILAAPVAQFAIYDENKLAGALGVQVDRDTRCLYRKVDGAQVRGPQFVRGINNSDNINRWVSGDTNLDGTLTDSGTLGGPRNQPDLPQARLFMLDRYTGVPRQLEVQP